MEYTFRTVTEAWTVLYDDLACNDEHNISEFYQSKPRNRNCNETIDISLKIMDPKNCLMWSNIRCLSPIYLAKEYLWYKSGNRDVNSAPSKVWKDLQNTDGDEKGLINSNYGAYIHTQRDNKNPELSVFEATVELLTKDPDSRQAVWQIPVMKHRQDNDTPCTLSLQFLLRDNKLNCIVNMRSCDIWFGLPNDITQFIMWQMELAKELNVELGWYKHVFGSLHVYEENFIKDFEQYKLKLDTFYLIGKQGIPYFKYYDNRDYKDILEDIQHDFNILGTTSKDNINVDDLKIEELKYMFNNMAISSFKH